MVSQRQLFFQHLAQTSPQPMALEIATADGIYLTDISGKRYIDLVSGVCTSNVGHGNKTVIEAVKSQSEKYMHLMVYGEFIQSPQTCYAEALTRSLPEGLDSVYFVNSGSEAIEGAIKLAKRFTRRFEVVSFINAYHGSTQGALSAMGNELLKKPFRPLIPGHTFISYNKPGQLKAISEKTACVIVEPIQAEAGVVVPDDDFLQQLYQQCIDKAALLIFDEIQTGFGRTGSLFAMAHWNVTPHIVTLAKSLGGGMPLGAFIASKEIMSCLSVNPALGHITTFGGHPVCCAAGLAAFEYLKKKKLAEQAGPKGLLFKQLLVNKTIKEIRGKGLLMAVDLGCADKVTRVIQLALEKGIILDYFLFCNTAFRIAPPLIITEEEIHHCCNLLNEILTQV